MLILLTLVNIPFGPATTAQDRPATPSASPVRRVLFGSCIRQDQPVPILETINQLGGDLFLFLGDNIYADTDDMKIMQEKYRTLAKATGFSRLRKNFTVMATWDDHDYGLNDAGSDYQMKEESRRLFLDFWKEPPSSNRRKHKGIYDARIFGPEGKRVQVILLDTRFFRGPLRKGPKRTGGPYYPNDDKKVPLLGSDQWKWLESQLLQPAEFRIVVSSIQLVAESAGQETWSNLPHERQRFFRLIKKTSANGVLVVSGDRHWSELSMFNDRSLVPYPVYDLTSSSLNQIHPRGTPTKNRFRIIGKTYHRPNFGQLEFQWGQRPSVTVSIHDQDGQVQFSRRILLEELQP